MESTLIGIVPHNNSMIQRLETLLSNSHHTVDGLHFYKLVCEVMVEYLEEEFVYSKTLVCEMTTIRITSVLEEFKSGLFAKYHINTLPYDVDIHQLYGKYSLNLTPVDIHELDTPLLHKRITNEI